MTRLQPTKIRRDMFYNKSLISRKNITKQQYSAEDVRLVESSSGVSLLTALHDYDT